MVIDFDLQNMIVAAVVNEVKVENEVVFHAESSDARKLPKRCTRNHNLPARHGLSERRTTYSNTLSPSGIDRNCSSKEMEAQ